MGVDGVDGVAVGKGLKCYQLVLIREMLPISAQHM